MAEPLMEFKKSYQTTEFYGTVLALIVFSAIQFMKHDLTTWAIATALLCSGYTIGRGLFKKNRADKIGSGGSTTEFYICLAGALSILYRLYTRQVDLGIGLICIAITWTAYNISRGHAKSLTPHGSKVYNLG